MEKNIVDDIFDVKNETDQVKSDDVEVDVVKQEKVKKDTNEVVSKDVNSELEKVKQQLADTKKWGNGNRETYMIAQKKIKDLVERFRRDEGILMDEDFDELSNVFEKNLDDNILETEQIVDNPIKNVTDNLKKTFDEYKKWSDESDLEYKFNAFFKDLDLVTDKRLNEIKEYMLSETDPKVLLKYVLDKGAKSYNKLYKPILEKGDAVSYVEELLTENKKLKEKLDEINYQLDDTEQKVYDKSTKMSSYKSNNKDVVGRLFNL